MMSHSGKFDVYRVIRFNFTKKTVIKDISSSSTGSSIQQSEFNRVFINEVLNCLIYNFAKVTICKAYFSVQRA